MTAVCERIKPWALKCLEGAQKTLAMASADSGSELQVCTIIHDPEVSNIYLVTDDMHGLPESVLPMLKEFLHFELSGRLPKNLQDAHGDIEPEEPLEEEDLLAESSLLLEIEELAVDDPDVKALEEDELAAHIAAMTLQEEELPPPTNIFARPSPAPLHATRPDPLPIIDCVSEEDFTEEIAAVPSSTESDTEDGEASAEEAEAEAVKRITTDLPPSAPTRCSTRVTRSSQRQSKASGNVPNSSATTSPSAKEEDEPPLRPTGLRAPGGRRRLRTSKSISSPASANESEHTFPFVLTDKQCSAIENPSTMSASINTDVYMKLTFNIDLEKVPGRTRQCSGSGIQAGKVSQQIRGPPVIQDSTATPASNLLVKDPDLHLIGCYYLEDYDIIICQNRDEVTGKPCGYGVPLGCLLSHCWGPDKGKVLSDKCDRVPHWIQFCKKRDTRGAQQSPYTSIQKAFLYRILERHPNVIVSVQEMRALQMRPDQFGPIAHIGEQIQGYKCKHCNFATYDTGKDTAEPLPIREHWQHHRRTSPTQHKQLPRGQDLRHTTEFESCTIQSFDRDKCNALWLSVPPSAPTTPAAPQKSFMQLLVSGQQSSVSKIAVSNIDRKAVLPFFLQNGAFDLILPLDPSQILELIELPSKQELGFHKLKLAVIKRFEKLCEKISKVPDQLRELLVAPKQGERGMLERFNCPARTSTIRAYALEELKLLCFVLRCLKQNKYAIGGSESPVPSKDGLRIGLTTQQFKSLQVLLQVLSSQSSAPFELDMLLDDVLRSIYMPDNCFEMFKDIFRNPSTLYVILRSTQPQGGFANPKDVTIHYARIQFGIRLTIMATILEKYEQVLVTNGQDGHQNNTDLQYVEFMDYLQRIVMRWGSEEHVSPHAFVRRCMKAMSRVARQAPSGQTVMWSSDAAKIMVQNHTVILSEYIDQVQSSLSMLAHKVDLEILFGIKFSPESFALPIETYDTQTLGFGLFTLSTEVTNSDYHPASYFLEQLCQRGVLCSRQGDEIIWDLKSVNRWLLAIGEAWSETLTLMHLLSLPGRGTEVSSWQYTNSATSPRHLFLSKSLGTLITYSNYNKTTAITGLHKHILRVIPFCLSTVIVKLLRIVRPVEMFAYTSQVIGNTSEIQKVYNTYMFVSHGKVWDSDMLSACLRNWFLQRLKVPFGLHLHRHFAQALQRMFLSYRQDDELAKMANLVMGHGGEVAGLNYAREAQDLTLDTSARRRMEQVGSDWITKVHKVDVSPTLVKDL